MTELEYLHRFDGKTDEELKAIALETANKLGDLADRSELTEAEDCVYDAIDLLRLLARRLR